MEETTKRVLITSGVVILGILVVVLLVVLSIVVSNKPEKEVKELPYLNGTFVDYDESGTDRRYYVGTFETEEGTRLKLYLHPDIQTLMVEGETYWVQYDEKHRVTLVRIGEVELE